MSLMKTLEMFIAANPGLTSRDIAEQFADFNVESVQRAVCRLHDLNFLTREVKGKECRYYAVNSEVVTSASKQPVDKGLDELVKRAEELQSSGLYRRAATLWMDIFKRSNVMTLRERGLKQRQQCLKKLSRQRDSLTGIWLASLTGALMKYSLIYADPAWEYDNKASNGAAEDHYDTMKLIDMKRLPVWDLAADDAVLAMWFTGTHTREAIRLAEAWGFKVRTMKGFTWVKLNALAERHINKALQAGGVEDFYDLLDLLNEQTRMNGGNYTRANTEDLLIATKGNGLERRVKNIKQVIYSPLGKHSQKPAEARYRLEKLYGDVPRIELFSRCGDPGWDHWGNQAERPAVHYFRVLSAT